MAWIIWLAGLFILLPARAVASDPTAPLLAGLFVNGRDSGTTVNLLREPDGHYTVDIDQFAAAIQTRVQRRREDLQLPTPLGVASLQNSWLIRHGKSTYVAVDRLAQVLAGKIDFDPGEFALNVKLAWTPGAPQTDGMTGIYPSGTHVPDIRAPSASLSTIHSEIYLTRQAGSQSLATLTDLQGALGPGSWRTRILTSPGGQQSMRSYGWTLDRGRSRLYLGHSEVALDPLLPIANLTGVQAAWSSRPDISYGDNLQNNQIVATQTLGGQTLSGRGPPGGIAELRMDGRVLSRTSIQLDGHWEFRDVNVRGTQFTEVALYERFGDGTPTRVLPVSAAYSPRSLPAHMLVAYAGAGANGNPLDRAIGIHGAGGFSQLRWGITDHLTVEAATQRADGRNYGVANAIVAGGALGTWGFGVARSGNANGWDVQGSGQHAGWYWNVFARQYAAGYFTDQIGIQSDRYGELGAQLTPKLDVSLVGRDATDPYLAAHYRFVRPAVSWRPTDQLNFSARPDYNGAYTYTAYWAASTQTRFNLSRYAGVSQLELTHAMQHGMQLDVAATRDPRLGTRYSQTLSGLWRNSHPVSWSVGLLEGSGRIGYLLDGAMETIPGLSVHAQLYNDPVFRSFGGGPTFQLSIVADFAVTPSGLARGSYSPLYMRQGAVSGRLDGELPANVHRSDLAGVTVLVDGAPHGTVDSGGRYLVSGLAPGVYQLKLDSEFLPIDLQPPEHQPWVEVRAGATTRADFVLQLRLGFAGRITRHDGRPAAGVEVLVMNAKGEIAGRAVTNPRGYYRIDELPPDEYTVRTGSVIHSVTLKRSFMYGQDLTLPPD
ncbi:carboxypeptidase regulatory-like domain-containing protein [Dyella sp. KRB-257]|uniref:carboxypeptidase regulatory-like domain-containing protein n=1 Tax=Dyella sp. KRB-257 TaxID=3400915 RepID=UPI003C001739